MSAKTSMKDFYVYAYLREDGTPYYIGKGRRYRIDKPHRHNNAALPPKERRIKLLENLTEERAHHWERECIRYWGRKIDNTGILNNLTEGGEGVVGFRHSDETKRKLRDKATKEWEERRSKGQTKMSEESRKKLSESRKGIVFDEAHRKKLSEAQKRRFSNPEERSKLSRRSGILHTEETKRKMSEAQKKKWEERRRNVNS